LTVWHSTGGAAAEHGVRDPVTGGGDDGWREKEDGMGKSNRARRAAKKRKQYRHSGPGDNPGSTEWRRDGPEPDLRYLLITAGRVLGRGASSTLAADLWESVLTASARRGSAGTAVEVDEIFGDCLEAAWEGGWQPAEVVRAVRRSRGDLHAGLAVTAVAAQHAAMGVSPPEAWSAQLQELGAAEPWWGKGRDWLGPWALRSGITWAEALRTAVEILSVLVWLPVIEAVDPPPSKWCTTQPASGRVARVDESVLAKVRALLAKAESTNFEHEADALTAKAQELMSRHAIDEAIAWGGTTGQKEAPSARRLPVDDPYASAKSTLLGVVAAANGVRAVWHQDFALMTLVGFEADLESVDLLFTSLAMQASKSVLAKGQIRDGRGRSRTRSFRQSFYVAFAQRIHERLELAAHHAREGAEQDLGRSLLPVLAGRRQKVDDATESMFPHLSKVKRSSVTNPDGWRAGRVAAEMATLGPVQPRIEGAVG
jgi:hypothetical protein